MASIEDMTDEEILASSMPGDRGYVMPELRDPILRGRESDDQALMSSIQAEPSYKIGTPDVAPITDDEATANEIARRDLAKSIGERTDPDLMDVASEVAAEFPSRVSRGAKQVYQGLDALATDILMFPVKYARSPLGEGAKIEQAAVDLAKGVASGDPESIRNAADIASIKDPSGVSDLTSAAASARLAYVEPEKRSSHLVDVGISGLAAAIPLVGSGMVKQVLRGAPDPKATAQLFPETIETTDGFKLYKVKTEDGFEYRDSLDPDAYDMSLKPEDIREMFKMSGDMPIPEDLSIALRAMDKDVSLAMYSTPPTPVFESVLEKAVNGLKQDKIGVDQVESQLQSIARKQGSGISASEIDATRLRDFLKNAKAAGKKSVSKDELIEHLNANKVQIEEVRIPEAQAREEYVTTRVPGGENYQEVLLTYKPKPGQGEFTASHHAEIPNVMVHYRTTDRTDQFGRKILFVEEIQSDWHQKARNIGYKNKRSTTIPPEVVRLAGQVDRLQAQMDSLPVLSRPMGYFSRGIRMASRIDPSVPSQSRYLESLQSDNLYTDFALDWFESLKGTKDFENLSDTRKGYLREFAEFNELRNERLPLINELQSARRTLFEATRNTPLSLTRLDPTEKISGKGFLERLESAVAKIKRDGAPDAPFKKTSAWTDLALKRIFRDAADGGYDGVAFTTGDDASFFINMPRDSAEYYYDKVVPSRVAKMSKKLGADFKPGDKTIIDIPDIAMGGFGGTTPNQFLYLELNAKAKQKAKQPQRLFEAVIGAGAGAAGVRAMKGEEVYDEET